MTCCDTEPKAFAAPDKAPTKSAGEDEVGLTRQRIIIKLLRQLMPVTDEFYTTLGTLMQCGVLTKDVIPDVQEVGGRQLQIADKAAPVGNLNPSPLAAFMDAKTAPVVAAPSRFQQDFERVELLGRGAFGEVWRCRHRLDGQEYAVKKVVYRASGRNGAEVERRALREARVWATISHPNIVRYHSAWVEMDWESWASKAPVQNQRPLPLEMDQSDSVDSLDSEVSDGGVVFLEESEEGKAEMAVARLPSKTPQAAPVVNYTAALYIQTELCTKDTLLTWITERNAAVAFGNASKEDLRAWAAQAASIFHQVVSALATLHKHNLAHRDLKPSNILLAKDGSIRLGDFGLAKILEGTFALEESEEQPRLTRTDSQGVGTPSYASPEQLQTGCYGLKTDIFALGIILAELLCPARTQMERAHLFERLRGGQGIFPEVAASFPKAAGFVKAMTSSKPEVRPSAEELKQAHAEISAEVYERLSEVEPSA